MTDLELDQQARQRVMEFLSVGAMNAQVATLEASYASDIAAPEIPASIAERTAADLMRFLRGEDENDKQWHGSTELATG